MKYIQSFDSVNEANKGKVHRAAKKGSYPAVVVVVQDGKVIHQEPVSTPDVAPATFNVMQEKYPKALLHLEDNTGKRLFSESAVTEAAKIETERYVRSHGKKPKGYGGWMFSYNRDGSDEWQIPNGMSWPDAQKWAKKKAKEDGEDYVYVMENESVVIEGEDTIGGLNKMANTDLERIADYADMIKDRMSQGQTLDAWMYSKISDSVKNLNSVHDTMDGNDGVNEAKEEPIVALLKLGLFASKGTGEKKLLRLSDDFEEIGDEQADEIASHLNMAIELFQDGYSKDAVSHFKKFNKACKDELALMKKQGLAESVVTEAKNTIGLAFKEEQDYLDFKEFVADQPRGAIRKNIGFDSKTKSWNVEMDVKVLDSIYGEGTPSDKKSGWYGGLPDDFESVIIESVVTEAEDYKYKKYVAKAFDDINDAMFAFRNAMGVKQLGQADKDLKKKLDDMQASIFALQKEMKSKGLTESTVNEATDLNDPVLVAFRRTRAIMELPKFKSAEVKSRRISFNKYMDLLDSQSDITIDIANYVDIMAQTLRDMEQEAEPEGGVMADKYGSIMMKQEKEYTQLKAKKAKIDARIEKYRMS